MASPKVKIHLRGVREVFAQPGVTAELLRRGEAIAEAATANVVALGYPDYDHHKAEVRTSRKTGAPIVAVHGTTHEAAAAQARHSTLTRAMDAGRG